MPGAKKSADVGTNPQEVWTRGPRNGSVLTHSECSRAADSSPDAACSFTRAAAKRVAASDQQHSQKAQKREESLMYANPRLSASLLQKNQWMDESKLILFHHPIYR
jgi:hypothetical protein